jgi:hypothetical protein
MRSVTIPATLAISLAVAFRAVAVCDQSGSNQADRDLWDIHGCDDFYKWHAPAYALQSADWLGRGWTDACNTSLEYSKHWNAAYLIANGIDDTSVPLHGTADYQATAVAAASSYHNAIRAAIGDGLALYGSYNTGVVTTYCQLYSPAFETANPASRGGDFMHEGWHAWMEKYGFDNGSFFGHKQGPMGHCNAESCDYFYFHGVSAYAIGQMYQTDGTEHRFHSPIQVQVEYLCDIVDHSKATVPESVRLVAQADANARGGDSFINAPGYACGDASPF